MESLMKTKEDKARDEYRARCNDRADELERRGRRTLADMYREMAENA